LFCFKIQHTILYKFNIINILYSFHVLSFLTWLQRMDKTYSSSLKNSSLSTCYKHLQRLYVSSCYNYSPLFFSNFNHYPYFINPRITPFNNGFLSNTSIRLKRLTSVNWEHPSTFRLISSSRRSLFKLLLIPFKLSFERLSHLVKINSIDFLGGNTSWSQSLYFQEQGIWWFLHWGWWFQHLWFLHN